LAEIKAKTVRPKRIVNFKTKSMKTNVGFRKIFFENSDDTGRFIVVSYRTGKEYFVEPIGPDRSADWGSYNPSTGKIENKKGFDKHRGAIDESDSLITKENGFTEIMYSGIGSSPFSVIEQLDSKYPDMKIKSG
jgi:hypothetical protein